MFITVFYTKLKKKGRVQYATKRKGGKPTEQQFFNVGFAI